MQEFFTASDGRQIAFARCPGIGPGVVFLGGFRSDMTGTKAMALEAWAAARGRAYLRFDYSGHGASGGEFRDGCIGQWLADVREIVVAQTDGPQVLVGSSMGGWLALLLAREAPARVAGLLTVAAAPDFTEGIWASLSDAQRAELMARQEIPYFTDDDGSRAPLTRRLIEDGRNHLVMTGALDLPMPVRFLQGSADDVVSVETARRLFDHATGPDLRLSIVKGADHRFSTPACLGLIEDTLSECCGRT